MGRNTLTRRQQQVLMALRNRMLEGDLIARVKVLTPENLTGEQKNLLKKFAESHDDDPRSGRPGWSA